jgi:hypothetical protein
MKEASLVSWLTRGTRDARRHLTDGMTCTGGQEVYDDETWAFIAAMDRLKRRLGRMPMCGEVLEESRRIGYSKQ